LHHTLGLGQIAAELGLEGHVGEIGLAIGERLFLIGLPEEARVVEAGTQDALVATADEALGVAGDIHYGDELRGQFSFRVLDGEIPLVVPHHRNENFFG
jgi:hypothetical protein